MFIRDVNYHLSTQLSLSHNDHWIKFSWLISRYKWKKFKTYKLFNFSPQLNYIFLLQLFCMPYLPATLRVWWFVSCWHWLQSYVFWQPLPSPRHLKSISKMMHQSPLVKKPVRNLLRARMTDCMTRWGGGAETHPYDDMFFETFLNWLLKVY